MASIRVIHGLAIVLSAFAVLAPPAAAQFVPTTLSTVETSAGIGATGTTNQAVSGPLPTATNVTVSSSWPPGGIGGANSSLQASADFGALRSLGWVTATGVGARGSAGLEMAGAPFTAAQFDDQVLVGGVGTQLFQLHYALTGNAGHIGPGQMQFAATLGLQVSGAGISIVSAPPPIGISLFPPFIDTYGFTVSGTAPRAIGLGDFLVISAPGGSTMNLNGALAAYLRVDNGAGGGETQGTLDLSNTAAFHIVPLSAGTTFTSASGHDYLTAVPEAGTAALMIGALPLLGWWMRRRRMPLA